MNNIPCGTIDRVVGIVEGRRFVGCSGAKAAASCWVASKTTIVAAYLEGLMWNGSKKGSNQAVYVYRRWFNQFVSLDEKRA